MSNLSDPLDRKGSELEKINEASNAIWAEAELHLGQDPQLQIAALAVALGKMLASIKDEEQAMAILGRFTIGVTRVYRGACDYIGEQLGE